ncbi:hypothetical protein ACTG9Q_23340 [Actinokineospora sp. 24-640]
MTQWVRGPVGTRWLSRTGLKTVLVTMPTMTAGTRLLDLLPVFDGDHRIQVVLTIPETADTWHGLAEFVRGCGAVVLPWGQAMRQEWDVVLCASHDCMEQMHGNVLLLPHGAGAGKSRKRSRVAGPAPAPTTGLDRELLTRGGRVIPAAIALPTEADRALLRERCPEAGPRAFIGGDVCLDRLRASLPLRAVYRRALGIDTELVTISSTWSPESTFGRFPELYERAVRELAPARVAAVLHPNIWAVHGAWQVRSWLVRAIEAGLLVIPPERGWQATMVASDVVIGDHGSTSGYAAAMGVRMCLAAFPDGNIRGGSVADLLGRTVPRLDLSAPLGPQVAAVPPCLAAPRVAAAISARQGQSHALLRRAVYGLLCLPEPNWPATAPPAQIPHPVPW